MGYNRNDITEGKRAKRKARRRKYQALRALAWMLIAGCVLAAAGLAVLLGINVHMKGKYEDRILSADEAAEVAPDCILVLGAGVKEGGRPSLMLKDRLEMGLSLYELGVSDRLLMSGDHGRVEYDEVNVMKGYVLERGLSDEQVFMDHAGVSTYDSMYRARDIFQVKKMVVVTQKYHMYRALYLANELGIEAYGVPAEDINYKGMPYFKFRESIARAKDFLMLLFKPEPTYLGEAIPISGSGVLTNDGKTFSESGADRGESNEESSEGEETQEEELPAAPLWQMNSGGAVLEERFPVPEGYERTIEAEGSFGEYMRHFPLKEHGSPVLLYDGDEKWNQSAHAAVFDMDVENRDLQQCTDSIMRVYAEYFWQKKAYDKIQFHLTNGFLMDYPSWRAGKRIQVSGNNVQWVTSAGEDASYENFRAYFRQIMNYAGTLSLDAESRPVELLEMKIGDMFLTGGSPGHCVLVVDMAVNDAGQTCFLLAQGYMPAQEFHVLNNPADPDCPWYFTEELTWPFWTPEYVFEEGSLKRWEGLE